MRESMYFWLMETDLDYLVGDAVSAPMHQFFANENVT